MLRLQDGDLGALDILYERYSRLLLGIGSQILRDKAEAEDLVQEVFLYLFRKNKAFDLSKGTVRSWLVGATYSRAFNRYKYLKNEILHVQSSCEVARGNGSNYSAGERDELGELLYWRSLLRQFFLELPEEQRLTLELHFFEGYTLTEISKKTGHSLGNVRHYCYRGLERLRKSLSQNGNRSLKET
jgi:RNA polymerase sigma-70 factor (ECF subfamily)